jgi:hypothetical protein
MNAKTLKALKASIKSWEERAAGTYTGKDGTPGCALCLLFHSAHNNGNGCAGCPVMERTELKYCCDTPVDDYELAERRGRTADMRLAAKAEVAFLKSLLPEGEK